MNDITEKECNECLHFDTLNGMCYQDSDKPTKCIDNEDCYYKKWLRVSKDYTSYIATSMTIDKGYEETIDNLESCISDIKVKVGLGTELSCALCPEKEHCNNETEETRKLYNELVEKFIKQPSAMLWKLIHFLTPSITMCDNVLAKQLKSLKIENDELINRLNNSRCDEDCVKYAKLKRDYLELKQKYETIKSELDKGGINDYER